MKAYGVILSGNEFGEWADVFQDNTISAAILDRILHHANVLKIIGDSYRLKERGDYIVIKNK